MEKEAPSRPKPVVCQHLRTPLFNHVAVKTVSSLGREHEVGEFGVAVADRQDLFEVSRCSG
jgi:hypothetical protein